MTNGHENNIAASRLTYNLSIYHGGDTAWYLLPCAKVPQGLRLGLTRVRWLLLIARRAVAGYHLIILVLRASSVPAFYLTTPSVLASPCNSII
jgi:hypothetical protein